VSASVKRTAAGMVDEIIYQGCYPDEICLVEQAK